MVKLPAPEIAPEKLSSALVRIRVFVPNVTVPDPAREMMDVLSTRPVLVTPEMSRTPLSIMPLDADKALTLVKYRVPEAMVVRPVKLLVPESVSLPATKSTSPDPAMFPEKDPDAFVRVRV